MLGVRLCSSKIKLLNQSYFISTKHNIIQFVKSLVMEQNNLSRGAIQFAGDLCRVPLTEAGILSDIGKEVSNQI